MKVPALTYHKVSETWELPLTMMRPRAFRRQMEFLQKKGYRGCSLKEYLAKPSKNLFVITFDDAYENIFTFAYPILKNLGFTATVFPVTDYIGRQNTWDISPGDIRIFHMNAQQICRLHTAGWEIASHGQSHKVMTLLSSADIKNELTVSKSILEDLLGDTVDTFCFPFGVSDDNIVSACKKAGYSHLVGLKDENNIIGRMAVYRGVDGRHSVYRKISSKHLFNFLEKIKEDFFHSFSAVTRWKQSKFK